MDVQSDRVTRTGAQPRRGAVIYQRVPAVWRVAHGRVLLQLIDGSSFELTGDPAAVWIASDEPATIAELEKRIAPRSINDLGATLEQLSAAGLLTFS